MLQIGLRVVRGPDWQWNDQDGGEGNVGTIVKIDNQGSNRTPDKTVVVIWDNNVETNYRVGYKNSYDLRIFDNAQIGVKHSNIICDGCRVQGIIGMRFRCIRCFDYDLCSVCYMTDKHDITHPFQRYTTPESQGVDLLVRKGCAKVSAVGVFPGAEVVRGHHWEWGNQDGNGSVGQVLGIRGWDNESLRSVANVLWPMNVQNLYRVGHKGKVDLKCVVAASGGTYYPAHLPVAGKEEEQGFSQEMRIGDKVCISVSVDLLKELQEGHGGWNSKMTEVVGKVGIVHRTTEKGDLRIAFDGVKWTLNPQSLTKVDKFTVGDLVCVSDNKEQVRQLQKDHGEWTDAMESILGMSGRVVKVYLDNDLRVAIDNGSTWTLNPLNVCLLTTSRSQSTEASPSHALNNSDNIHNPDDGNKNKDIVSVDSLLKMSDLKLDSEKSLKKLMKETAQGHLAPLSSFLQLYPDKVNMKVTGRSWLQVACHQGHTMIVSLLLSRGADVSLSDEEGDSPLHYAAFGNRPRVMEQLLNAGADINAVNVCLSTPLHISVSKQHLPCVKFLLSHNSNVNMQDSYGDTPLHDAIIGTGESGAEIVELLCNQPSIDFTLRNNRGFSPLHHAALKGNTVATEKLASRVHCLVDVKKDDGFAALHLACLNGHKTTAEVLLSAGSCKDLPNTRKYTPLMLAASKGHASVVELLVCSGANLQAQDEEGDTCLHMVLLKRSSITNDIPELHAPTIFGIWQELGGTKLEESVAIAIACYLVQEGASLQAENLKGLSPLDVVAGSPIPDLLNRYLPQLKADKAEKSSPVECTICCEAEANTLLEPCGHRVACEDCSSKLKKCLKCHTLIDKRIAPDGKTVAFKTKQPKAECLKYLESKIAEIEEVHFCSICMERERNVAFLCGHGACDNCSQTLRTCHMCRKTITKKINLYY